MRQARARAEIGQALSAAVEAEAGGRDIAALAAERDRFLIDLLTLKGNRRAVREGDLRR
jgi:hypothetical protein